MSTEFLFNKDCPKNLADECWNILRYALARTTRLIVTLWCFLFDRVF